MLAKRRSLKLNGIEIQRTPLLVPSFSSKGFTEVAKIIETTKEVIEGPTLVSAYDIHHGLVTGPFDFASMLFLDSGGYESSKDWELSEISEREYHPRPWSQALHDDVLAQWRSTMPTVFISYDHPKERQQTGEQIARARAEKNKRPDVMHEILLKPETEAARFLNVQAILRHVHDLAPFDAIGVTEKEVGNSILERMENIAKLRIALTTAGMDMPIHVFGSLDTITSPMYFLAGADIFDGLTWLRFAFYRGYTMYKHNFGAIDLGAHVKTHLIDGRSWFHNYGYLMNLQLEMRRYLNDGDVTTFTDHSDLFRQALQTTMEAVRA